MGENKRQDKNAPKDQNDVRIGMSSIVGKVIGYCNLLLTEKKFRNIKFTAMGGAIGKLVNVVENLKVFHAGLNQSNFLTTVSYQAVDRTGKVFNERLHPKMEVNLSFDTIATPEQGFVQAVVPEEERKNMQALMDKRREERQKEAENRPQRGVRGRGQRGAPRGQRGGYRGQERGGFRGQERGGFRGQRGAPRGQRGAPRGQRNY